MLQSSLFLTVTGLVAAGAYSVTRANRSVDVKTELKNIKSGSDALKSLLIIQKNIQKNMGRKPGTDELLSHLVDRLRNEVISEDIYLRIEGLVNDSDFIGPESFALVVFYSACQRAIVESSGVLGDGGGEL